MRIPKPKPPIDLDDLLEALEAGETGASYARRAGYSVGAVYDLLRRSGVNLVRPPRTVRDGTDAALHSLWQSIRDRCEKPEHPKYELYGARGIRVCRVWHDFVAFRNWARETGYMSGQAISLRSRARGYRPANCSWIDRGEAITEGMQASGRGTVLVTAFGETKSATAWERDPRAKVCGETIRLRARSGFSHQDAITLGPNEIERGTLVRYRAPVPKGYTVIDWKRARRFHCAQGFSVSETAKLLGASYHGVLRGLQKRGWLREREPAAHTRVHGPALYKAWSGMRERCTSHKHPEFTHIGGRGIEISRDWQTFAGFHAWALKAGYGPGLVLTRLRREEDYGPTNCAWIPRSQAGAFHRPLKVDRTPKWTINAFGETKGPFAWSRDRRCAVSMTGLVSRLRGGASPERAITDPPQTKGKRGIGRLVRAFGVSKTLTDWGKDRRAKVSAGAIGDRLTRGMKPEAAITTPPFEA